MGHHPDNLCHVCTFFVIFASHSDARNKGSSSEASVKDGAATEVLCTAAAGDIEILVSYIEILGRNICICAVLFTVQIWYSSESRGHMNLLVPSSEAYTGRKCKINIYGLF